MPLYDDQPTRRAPLVTYALIALNFLVFLMTPMATFGNSYGSQREQVCDQAVFIRRYGAVPQELTDNAPIPIPGPVAAACGLSGDQTPDKNPFLSAFSSMFLHSGWVHLLGNMIYLFVFGQATEDRLGRLRFLLFYLGCGLVAAYGFAITYPDSTVPLIGASGAVAGVLGSHLVMYPRSRTIALVSGIIPFRLPAWVLLGQFFVLQWISLGGESDGVAYVAHIYGFLAGGLLGLLARSPLARDTVLLPRR